MTKNCYLKPAWTHNGSVVMDLPLRVPPRAGKRKTAESAPAGQLCCVGKVFMKTRDGLVRIM